MYNKCGVMCNVNFRPDGRTDQTPGRKNLEEIEAHDWCISLTPGGSGGPAFDDILRGWQMVIVHRIR